MFLKDPKTDKKSVTLTMLAIGFVVALIKLTLSGSVLFGTTFTIFTASDFALVIGSLGALYGGRKFTENRYQSSPRNYGNYENSNNYEKGESDE